MLYLGPVVFTITEGGEHSLDRLATGALVESLGHPFPRATGIHMSLADTLARCLERLSRWLSWINALITEKIDH